MHIRIYVISCLIITSCRLSGLELPGVQDYVDSIDSPNVELDLTHLIQSSKLWPQDELSQLSEILSNEESSEDLLWVAASMLREVRVDGTWEPLLALSLQEESIRISLPAISALAVQDPERAVEVYCDILSGNEYNREQKISACRSLAKLNDPRATAILWSIAQREIEFPIPSIAVGALASLDVQGINDNLVDMLINEDGSPADGDSIFSDLCISELSKSINPHLLSRAENDRLLLYLLHHAGRNRYGVSLRRR